MLCEELLNLPQPRTAPLDAVREVGPLERAGKNARRRGEKIGDNLGARRRRRGRGDCDDLADADSVGRFAQTAIFGTKLVSPMGDAVRFIDGHHLRMRGAQGRDHCRLIEPLRRDVKQL
jgi:hypothetical protein